MVACVLHHVAVDRVRLQIVQLSGVEPLSLQAVRAVEAVGRGVCIRECAGGVQSLMRHVTATVTLTHSHTLVTERVVVAGAATATAISVHMFSLQLVLNALAIRRVPDKRQNRPDALDEQGPLARLGVIQGSLSGKLSRYKLGA